MIISIGTETQTKPQLHELNGSVVQFRLVSGNLTAWLIQHETGASAVEMLEPQFSLYSDLMAWFIPGTMV